MTPIDITAVAAACGKATPIAFGDERIPARVWRKVTPSDSCWDWTGARSGSGYGRMKNRGRSIGVHQFVLHCLGIETVGLEVMHSCDRPVCVNPNHLSPGTASDNQQDRVRKGRHSWAARTECPQGHSYEIHGVTRSGKRYCRLCQTARSLRYQARIRAAAKGTP